MGQPVKSANGRFVVKLYTPDKSAEYKTKVRWLAKAAMRGRKPLEGPLRLSLDMRFALLKSGSQKWQRAALAGEIRPVVRPDGSNVAKGIEDALNGVCWIDDSQVVSCSWEKRYALEACVLITVESLSAAVQPDLLELPAEARA
jgi:Holliday junction resolvase RusA-like endonuclease